MSSSLWLKTNITSGLWILKRAIFWTNKSHSQAHSFRTPTVALEKAHSAFRQVGGQVATWNPLKVPKKCSLETEWQQQSLLTLPIASAMDSTIPPTMPPSLAASFRVTMMSSTASFISWAASLMASCVWDAWGHGQLINVTVTPSRFSQEVIHQLDNSSTVHLKLVRTQCPTRGRVTRLVPFWFKNRYHPCWLIIQT